MLEAIFEGIAAQPAPTPITRHMHADLHLQTLGLSCRTVSDCVLYTATCAPHQPVAGGHCCPRGGDDGLHRSPGKHWQTHVAPVCHFFHRQQTHTAPCRPGHLLQALQEGTCRNTLGAHNHPAEDISKHTLNQSPQPGQIPGMISNTHPPSTILQPNHISTVG